MDILSTIMVLLFVVPMVILPMVGIFKILKKVTPTETKDLPIVSVSEVYEEIGMIIDYECNSTISQELLYGTLKEITSRESSPLNRIGRIVSDDIIDNLTISVSARIIDNMSEIFRNKISQVIKEEKIDDFIVNGVYQVIYTKAMEVNINL